MEKIIFENVSKEFKKGVFGVKNLNFKVDEGDFFVILGPSGCGKSTTLRLIAGLEKPTEGNIYINGKIVNNLEPRQRNVAMVFQSYALYPHMTVYENIAFPLKNFGYKKHEIEKKVNEVAKLLGLEKLLDRKPRELSGGQKQRVALGRAIVRNPEVFLFDEPLSNLDAKLRVKMRGELLKLHKKLGATSVYVTHDQAEAMTLGTKIMILKDGEMQQIGKPKDIYENPANKFVGSFLGKMNFVKGIVFEEKGELYAKTSLGNMPLKGECKKFLSKREIEIGVRPEHLRLDEKGVKGEILGIEFLGHETYLEVKLSEGEEVTVVLPYFRQFYVGEKVGISVDYDKILVFEDGKNVLYKEGG